MKQVIKLKDLDLSNLNQQEVDINSLLSSNTLLRSIMGNTWIEEQDSFHDCIKQYTIYSWYCTDSKVGINLFTFNGELLCYSTQLGRKSDVEFTYFSRDIYTRFQQHYLNYVIGKVEEEYYEVEFKTVEETEVDIYYKIDFTSQLFISGIHKFGFYDGKKVELLRKGSDEYPCKSVYVLIDGSEELLDLKDVYFSVYV